MHLESYKPNSSETKKIKLNTKKEENSVMCRKHEGWNTKKNKKIKNLHEIFQRTLGDFYDPSSKLTL